MREKEEYFTSGELAKISGVSYKTIRYYVEKGLLQPENITECGYKLYSKQSVEKLQKIIMLKYLDFSLSEIQKMLDEDEQKISFDRQEELLREKMVHLNEILQAVTEMKQISADCQWDKMLEIMKISSRKEEIQKQYLKSNKLENRINIHVYSTAKESWYQWLFEKFELAEGMHILDVGCGNAMIWTEMQESIPNDVKITLLDRSEALLTAAKGKLSEYQMDFQKRNIQITYQQMDAENLFLEGEYDRILANHMLYHIADDKRECLIKKMSELLTKNGRLIASTIGQNHMKEIFDLIQEYDKSAEIPVWMSEGFCLENGEKQLEPYLSKIQMMVHDNNLSVPDSNAVFNYLESLPGNIHQIVLRDEQKIKKYLKEKISEENPFFIQKVTGVFIAEK